MSSTIDLLNRRLGEALGCASGSEPRFRWMRAQDLYYFYRPNVMSAWQRINWSDRLGRVWLLTGWSPPVGIVGDRVVPVTREQWWTSFHGEFPYPEKGRRNPYPETALRPGLEPDAELTQFYIRSIGSQMRKSAARLEREIRAGLQKDRDDNRAEFMHMADDSFPAFWSSNGGAHTPGTRGGHVSFGGVKP